MIPSNSTITIPNRVEEKLREVRGTRDRTRLTQAIVLGLLALFVAMSAAMFVDWTFTFFDTFWRSLLTVCALATAGLTLVVTAALGFFRRRQLAQVAGDVDRSVLQTEERWSTIAELAAAPLDQQRQVHSGMLHRLSQESIRLESHVVPKDVVPKRGLQYSLAGLCGMVILLLVAGLMDWQQTSVLVQRFWAPTSNISATQLSVPADQIVAARGEPLSVQASMQGRLVDKATLFLKTKAAKDSEQISLRASGDEGNQFVHHIKAASHALTYRMRAGDGQTEWTSVTIADRPEIAGVRFRAIPPAYTGKKSVEINELPEKISIIEGSTLEMALRPRDPVENVVLRLGEKEARKLKSPDGRWYPFRRTMDEDLTMTVVLTESHGLENRHPPVCRIHVYPDKAPSVRIVSPTEEMAARPDDEIEIEFSASDDMGIAKAELVLYGEELPDGTFSELQVIDIPLGDQQNQTTVEGAIPLDLKPLDLEDGQSFSYAVRVYDTRQETASTTGLPSSPKDASDLPISESENSRIVSKDFSNAGSDVPESPKNDDSTTIAANRSSENVPSEKAAASSGPARPSTPPSPNKTREKSLARNASQTAAAKGSQAMTETKSIPSSTTDIDVASTKPESSSDAQSRSPSTKSPETSKTETPARASSPGNANNTAQTTPPSSSPSQDDSEETGAARPSDNMTRRSLDVAQTASSGMMKLKIDRWSGSFAGQQRRKLEMMISPTLQELDQVLEIADTHLREALDALESDLPWARPQDRLLRSADSQLAKALKLIDAVLDRSHGTPYAFIGLQLGEIADTHLFPAKDSLWTGRQADANPARKPPVEAAWQQTGRARQRLAQLVSQFERIRREHALADSIEQVKEMYQVFVENSFELLDPQRDSINNYQRKMAQFELDEEYLRRLEEVLAMRQKLVAEFARILSNDPRLLRRFVDSLNSQSDDLRDQLTLLTLRQQELDTQVRSWHELDDDLRPRALADIIRRKLLVSIDIAQATAQLQEDFDTWTPLNLEVDEDNVLQGRSELAAIAGSARELENKAAGWRSVPPQQTNETSDAEKTDAKETDAMERSMAMVIANGHDLYERLQQFDARLLELSTNSENSDLEPFTIRRLAQTRRLIAQVSGWVYQLEQLNDGHFHIAAGVDQHLIAQETSELTANLANLEQQLAGVVGGDVGELPEDIAELSRKLLSTLDERVAASQLGAVFSLRRKVLDAAVIRTHKAAEGMVEAERLFDELMKRVLEEADKLPVQDPIASLLDDPTLDELLALLENEADLAAALRIPPRPSNLRVIGDFLRSGRGGGGGAGSSMVMSQMNSQQRMLQRAAQQALNRAKAETDPLSNRRPRQIDDWNILAGELDDRLLQGQGQLPPERYRRAIEQYFEELSRKASDQGVGSQ